MTDEQKNKLVNLGVLETFLSKLMTKIGAEYITSSDVQNNYASKNGVSGQFSIGSLKIPGLQDVVIGTTVVRGNVHIRFKIDDQHYVDIPVGEGITLFATSNDILNKADSVRVENEAYTITPQINVLKGLMESDSSMILNIPKTQFAIDDILYIKGYSNITQNGIYRITSEDTSSRYFTKSDIKFITTASKYLIYYCCNDDKFYRYDPILGMTAIAEHSMEVPLNGNSYELATDADILNLLQGLGLSDETDDNNDDNNEEEQ